MVDAAGGMGVNPACMGVNPACMGVNPACNPVWEHDFVRLNNMSNIVRHLYGRRHLRSVTTSYNGKRGCKRSCFGTRRRTGVLAGADERPGAMLLLLLLLLPLLGGIVGPGGEGAGDALPTAPVVVTPAVVTPDAVFVSMVVCVVGVVIVGDEGGTHV